MIPTFLIGLLSLLGWLLVTSGDRTAMRLLRKGALYFIFGPLILVPYETILSGLGLSSQHGIFLFSLIVVFPLIEEGLKVFASRHEALGSHVFALVALFGVIELTLSKPLTMATTPDHLASLFDALTAVPAFFLHLLTAAIYAFHWRARRDLQFITCVGIHGLWNAAVSSGRTPDWALLATVPMFVVAIWYLVPRSIADWRRDWNAIDEQMEG